MKQINKIFSKGTIRHLVFIVIVLISLFITFFVIFRDGNLNTTPSGDFLIIAILLALYALWVYSYEYIVGKSAALDEKIEKIIVEQNELYNQSVDKLIGVSDLLYEKIKNYEEYGKTIVASSRAYDLLVDDMSVYEWCDMLDQKVWSLDIDTKIKNLLIKNDLWTIRSLVSISTEELVERTGLGDTSIKKLRKALRMKCKYLHLELLYIDETIDYKKPERELLDPFIDLEINSNDKIDDGKEPLLL